MAAVVSPLIELSALLVLGFAWIYFDEWGDVPVLWAAVLLITPIVSLPIGILHWFGLLREFKHVSQITLMHGITEFVTLAAAGTAFGFFLHRRLTDPPTADRDVRTFEQLMASSSLAIMGSIFGIVVFFLTISATGANLKAEYQKLLSRRR